MIRPCDVFKCLPRGVDPGFSPGVTAAEPVLAIQLHQAGKRSRNLSL